MSDCILCGGMACEPCGDEVCTSCKAEATRRFKRLVGTRADIARVKEAVDKIGRRAESELADRRGAGGMQGA